MFFLAYDRKGCGAAYSPTLSGASGVSFVNCDPRIHHLVLRWQEERRQGHLLSIEELCADCRELIDAVARQIDALSATDALAAPSNGNASQPLPPDPLPMAEQSTLCDTVVAPLVSSSGRLLPAQAGRFELLSEIARGGMGTVLKGHDPELDRELAVKIVLPECAEDPTTLRRFLDEARLAGQLQHPGVVPVYEMGRLDDGRPFFAMKLIQGRTLADLLRERAEPRHDLPRFLKYFEAVCQTVGYAHARGVIHRDLKPLNVMVGAFGEVVVMDWGLAKALRNPGESDVDGPSADATPVSRVRPDRPIAESMVGIAIGTPAYMAPEQARGERDRLDQRADVFGLGAILCEILTGQPPFQGPSTLDTLMQAASGELGEVHARLDSCGADADLVRLARACLATELDQRPANGSAVAEAVSAYLNGVQERLHQAELERAQAQARAEGERKRRRLVVALTAAVLVVVGVVGGAWVWVTQEHAAHLERRAQRTQQAEAELRTAVELRHQARAVPLDDRSRWHEAFAAAKRAEALLAGGDADPEVQGRVQTLLGEMKAEQKDRRLVAKLEEARLQQLTVGPDGAFDKVGASALYAQAFRDDGGDITTMSPAEAADYLRPRAIREQILAALDDWAFMTPDAKLQQRLQAILAVADGNGTSIRHRWRAAIGKREMLAQLAAEADVEKLRPSDVAQLGRYLYRAGGIKEAVQLWRRAWDKHPNDFWINFALAFGLGKKEEPAREEVIRFYSIAVAVRPTNAVAHVYLGDALMETGRMKEATAEYRQAIKFKSDYFLAHLNLGLALRQQGQFKEGLDELQRGIERMPPQDVNRQEMLKMRDLCQCQLKLEDRLPAILQQSANPISAAEGLEFAEVCRLKKLNAAAARLAHAAFAAAPKLADDVSSAVRFNAACAAALAGCGKGNDAAKLDYLERLRWCKQALDWLRADLSCWAKTLDTGKPEDRQLVRKQMRQWQTNVSLACVRDANALQEMPEAERNGWQKFWNEVAALRKRAADM
jgi:serine/threonine-protein kinase